MDDLISVAHIYISNSFYGAHQRPILNVLYGKQVHLRAHHSHHNWRQQTTQKDEMSRSECDKPSFCRFRTLLLLQNINNTTENNSWCCMSCDQHVRSLLQHEARTSRKTKFWEMWNSGKRGGGSETQKGNPYTEHEALPPLSRSLNKFLRGYRAMFETNNDRNEKYKLHYFLYS